MVISCHIPLIKGKNIENFSHGVILEIPKRIDVSLDEDNDKEVLGKNGEDHVYDQDDDDAN